MRIIKVGIKVEFTEYEVCCFKCECRYVVENENDHTRVFAVSTVGPGSPGLITSKCPQCHFVNERLEWHHHRRGT